uniref:NADH dehydrogenase subunit 5 n=1 Tax=Ctenolepisma longicaudatum TaxID=27554 RepID=UPI0024359B7F|nr:NADH dehydrogenase subunit 5 [Ctenolepisma longicaudatum]WEX31827.1 NADH dehydrogenase subunit 5 [Ctenolepisma longicaudatum]
MLWMFHICFVSFVFLFFFSLLFFVWGISLLISNTSFFIEWEVISVNSSPIVMTILLDWMSLIFMSFVLYISGMVIYYSKQYMSSDPYINRFIILVLMFVLSMMLLIISPNMISILLGWDGLGLVSYCLVIYYQNMRSYGAGMLTALSNRIGDVCILLAIAWMLNYGSWNYIFYLGDLVGGSEMMVIVSFIILAAMTKSAQIPFSAWLPAAMAAPTPVSALVHSSTLVTAGVYLLIRFSDALTMSFMGSLLLLFSGLTMFMAGVGANYEYDLSKIIALSTLSQLGLMMMILSMGYAMLAFFHLIMHALFKALLFLCAGAIIHGVGDTQDIRCMGGLVNQMPLTLSCLNTANLALCGVPFLAGFYSKDLILEVATLSCIDFISFFLLFFSTGLTVCYSVRLSYYLTGMGFSGMNCHAIGDNSNWVMIRGMLGLTLGAVVGGSVMSWILFSCSEVIVLPFFLKMWALAVSGFGAWVGFLLSSSQIGKLSTPSGATYFFMTMMGSMWFLPYLSTNYCIRFPLYVGGAYTKVIDQGWSEMLGGQGAHYFVEGGSVLMTNMQHNEFKVHLFFSFIMILFLISIYLLF